MLRQLLVMRFMGRVAMLLLRLRRLGLGVGRV
jgi:hypothetical protein